ncbi:MAG: TVP38/TMEM64 family protein [Burkholderiales bacterium]|nr:TVP38/TMEM64 family protein [Burkholderiales bacterium]MDE2289469.1 TVP38/TMEM64 family protein [Burkholderiales bacterium]MDE2609282.1 TVP38/TMEM64 family protein [Burkholderiales bacterium]
MTTILLLVVAGVLAGWVLPRVSPYIGFDTSVAGTAKLIRSWGAWGMAASIALMVIHSFLPFPAEIVALANGLVYGPVWGAALTWSGAMLGACAAFGVGRLLGRPLLQRFLPSESRQRLAVWSRTRGSGALLVSRLIPIIAFNVINYAAALAEISWWTFLWTTALGILPLTILFAVLGDQMLHMPLWAWLGLSVIVAIAWIALHRGHHPQDDAERRDDGNPSA